MVFPLIHGVAENVPLPAESFDFAISKYGAAIWADPYRWIPEAWRLLRPGGQLVFLGSSAWSIITSPLDGDQPTTRQLFRNYFDLHRIEWAKPSDGIEFNLPISEWFRLFRDTGFEVLDFREPRPEITGPTKSFFTTREWSRAYPAEQVWKLRKVSRR